MPVSLNPVTEIKDLEHKIATLGSQIEGLKKQVSSLGGTLSKTQGALEADAKALTSIGTSAQALLQEVGAVTQQAEAWVQAFSGKSAWAGQAATIVAAVATQAEGMGQQAAAIAQRLEAGLASGLTHAQAPLTTLAGLRGQAGVAVAQAPQLFDAALVTAGHTALNGLQQALRGDGATYRQQLVPALEELGKQLGLTCGAFALEPPFGLDVALEALKRAVPAAPDAVLDALAALVPLSQLQLLTQQLPQIRPAPQAAPRATPRLGASGKAIGMLVGIGLAHILAATMRAAVKILPVDLSATVAVKISLAETVAIGGAGGVFASAGIEGFEGVAGVAGIAPVAVGAFLLGPIATFGECIETLLKTLVACEAL